MTNVDFFDNLNKEMYFSLMPARVCHHLLFASHEYI